ncbi:alpha/beta hydrolase [bacterium]|nr:alpha/beta hydrolase [bacterium]
MTHSPLRQSLPWDCRYVGSGKGPLFCAAALRDPDSPLLLVCNAVGEEAKCSFSVLQETARYAWEAGWSVARFDYRGCGDSPGEFGRTGPRDWLEDSETILTHSGASGERRRSVLLGLRLGANVAARIAPKANDLFERVRLVLWEPILDLPRYVRHLEWMNREPGRANGIDHLGWEFSRECLEDLEGSLQIDAAGISFPSLIVHIGSRRSPAGDFVRLPETLPPASRFEHLRERPFWEPIGMRTCPTLADRTLAFLKEEHP